MMKTSKSDGKKVKKKRNTDKDEDGGKNTGNEIPEKNKRRNDRKKNTYSEGESGKKQGKGKNMVQKKIGCE